MFQPYHPSVATKSFLNYTKNFFRGHPIYLGVGVGGYCFDCCRPMGERVAHTDAPIICPKGGVSTPYVKLTVGSTQHLLYWRNTCCLYATTMRFMHGLMHGLHSLSCKRKGMCGLMFATLYIWLMLLACCYLAFGIFPYAFPYDSPYIYPLYIPYTISSFISS